jgi:uncharacterized damage-inducible protein DinB
MKWHDVVMAGFEGVFQTLQRALDGLSEDDLNWRPRSDCNSIGWLAWHLTRVQDGMISTIMGKDQLWLSAGWHAKFGRPPEAGDVGAGHTPQDVAGFKSPDARTLLDYHRAVLERSQQYLSTLSEADLDRDIQHPHFQPPPKVGVFLNMMLSDNLQHAGQVAYIRGLRQGMGWQKF